MIMSSDSSSDDSSSVSEEYFSEPDEEIVQAEGKVRSWNERKFTFLRNETGPSVCLATKEDLEADALVLRISPDNSLCAVGLSNGDIRLFQLISQAGGRLAVRLKAPEAMPCTDIRFLHKADGSDPTKHSIVATYASGHIRIWSCKGSCSRNAISATWKESVVENEFLTNQRTKVTNQILCLSVAYDNEKFITGGTDAHIRVYTRNSQQPGKVLRPSFNSFMTSGHTSHITALCYHPRGKIDPRYLPIFVSASWDNSIQIWNDQNGNSLWQIYGPHVAGNDGLDIDPIRNTITTCSWVHGKTIIETWQFPENALGMHNSTVDGRRQVEPLSRLTSTDGDQSTKGYVAKYDSTYRYLLFGGSDKHMLQVLDMQRGSVIAKRNLDFGVYSGAICTDQGSKRGLKIFYTNGKSVNIEEIGIPNR